MEGSTGTVARIRVMERSRRRAGSRLALPESVVRSWPELGRSSVVPVRMGAWRGTAEVSAARLAEARWFPGAGEPAPPPGISISARYNPQENSLQFGPVLGILSLYRYSRRRVVGAQMATYRQIMRIGREANMVVFLFKPADVSWSLRRVRGCMWTGTRWQVRTFPLPDAVYNRIQNRKVERRRDVRRVLQRLEEEGVHVFNPHFLDKWRVYEALMKEPKLLPYLPETRRYRAPGDLAVLLRRHGGVFLKPSGGSLGLGTFLVRKAPGGGGYEYRANGRNGSPKAGRLLSLRSIAALLARQGKGRRYVVQQAITLARIDGRPFDVRVLVQKDQKGQWTMTGAAGRVAGRGRITTHVPRGGSHRSLSEVLAAAAGPSPQAQRQLLDLMSKVCLDAAGALEEHSGRRFGELSLDVGLDGKGGVWIFEINAKPFRFDEPTIRRKAQARLLGYAAHLAGF